MAKKTIKKTTKKKEAEPSFIATLKVLGRLFEGRGDSVIRAIEAIQVRNLRGACVLTVSRGEASKERILPSVSAQRCFSGGGTMRQVWLKQIADLFDV